MALEHPLAEALKRVLDIEVENPGRTLNPAHLSGGVVYSVRCMDSRAGTRGKLNSAAPGQTRLLGLTWHGESLNSGVAAG